MYCHQTLSDHERLELIKLAFPRPDLIKWFDECATGPTPHERYMLLLLMTAAAILCPPHMRRLHYGSQPDITRFQNLRPDHRNAKNRAVIIGSAGASRASEEFVDPEANQIGLIQGICDEYAGRNAEATAAALTTTAPNARRICILSDHVFGDFLNLNIDWQGHLVYQGILQYWPGRTTHVVYRSYIEPTE
jgi:hypothetical protein